MRNVGIGQNRRGEEAWLEHRVQRGVSNGSELASHCDTVGSFGPPISVFQSRISLNQSPRDRSGELPPQSNQKGETETVSVGVRWALTP